MSSFRGAAVVASRATAMTSPFAASRPHSRANCPARRRSSVAAPASALQPVATFLEHAATWNPDNRAARAISAERDSEVTVSTGSLLPSFTRAPITRATNTRSRPRTSSGCASYGTPAQIVTTIDSLSQTVITPQNQVDASLAITVAAQHRELGPALGREAPAGGGKRRRSDDAAGRGEGSAQGLLPARSLEALSEAATKSLEISRNNLKIARDKDANGTGSELDVQRASPTRHAPACRHCSRAGGRRFAERPVRPERDRSRTIRPSRRTTFTKKRHSHVARRRSQDAAGRRRRSTREAATPQRAQQRRCGSPRSQPSRREAEQRDRVLRRTHRDVRRPARRNDPARHDDRRADPRRQRAAAAARGRGQGAPGVGGRDLQGLATDRADVAQARSARAQVGATQLAAKLAEQRYENGVATQLDVLGARQDAFEADVVRIQADADLAYARVALRIDSGSFRASSNER